MRVPLATYRVQFNPDFNVQHAREVIPYLLELGISDVYASPMFKAKKGSRHGYDVVDMNQLNPDLGSRKDFELLFRDVKNAGLGWLQDIVPNHMAFDGENLMLMDLLENGKHSEYYNFFDIEWDHVSESLSERLLAPFLGRHYSESLASGEIALRFGSNGFHICYYSLNLPLKIESYVSVLSYRLEALKTALGDDHPELIKFVGILFSLQNLPQSRQERAGRISQIQFIKSILWELYKNNRELKEFIDENIALFNGEKKAEEDITLLDNLLSEQLFRLSFWKVATEELNYRRFFNINGLISLRVENIEVFERTHALILDLLKKNKISGLRIDHIDGLYDPTGYLKTVRDRAGDIYIAVEKILAYDEELSSLWAVQGTTGYDFINYMNGIFVNEEHGRVFNKIYYQFAGFKQSFDAFLYEKRKLIIEKEMTGDVDNLAHLLKRISAKNRYGNDMTLYGLKEAIVEILAHFPVYRTYVRTDYYNETDRRYMTEAVRKARELNPALLYEFSFIELFLLLRFDNISEKDRDEWVHFVMRFQQVTGPLMAKGFEDTILYFYNRLLSLNEVGGNPERFGISLEAFHEFNKKRSQGQPHSMSATSTHDTKRGEDVRARLNVLSEIPDQWEAHLKKWSKENRRKKKSMKGMAIPEKNDEYFLYQTLIGALPFKSEEFESFRVRLKEYIIKAVREAKVHTAWLKPDTDYEDNYLSFIDKILTPSDKNNFLDDFLRFQKMVSFYGIFNSLSQALIKITAPGFPDFYQGSEFWDLNLVDPDNRRPVDFQLRMWLLKELKAKEAQGIQKLIQELFLTKADGRIKLFLIYKALSVRQKQRALFEKGSYITLETSGKFRNHLTVYARVHKPVWAVIIVPRFFTGLVEEDQLPLGRHIWHDTRVVLPGDAPDAWTEMITGSEVVRGRTFYAGDVLNRFPGALLMNKNRRSHK